MSANRPGPDKSAGIGGASLVVDPSGEVVLETEASVAAFELTGAAVASARASYPGYLARPAGLYALGWNGIA